VSRGFTQEKYQQHIENPDKGGPPVAAVPQETAAKLPEPTADSKPPEMPTAAESDPVGEAERSALRQRIAEMDRAATITQQASQQPRLATEPQQPQQVPAQVQEWLSKNPHYLTDAVGQAELQLATLRSLRDGRTWADDDFIDVLERNLGLSRQTQPQSNGKASDFPTPLSDFPTPASPKPAPRPVIQRQGAPVSAPPTRQVPSMTTGRPVSDVRLTVEEAALAQSLGLSEQEYMVQKKKMVQLKQVGAIQNGQQ
jgi:hypothetical protein